MAYHYVKVVSEFRPPMFNQPRLNFGTQLGIYNNEDNKQMRWRQYDI